MRLPRVLQPRRAGRDAYSIYLILTGIHSLLFFMIVSVDSLYQATIVHLNPLQLVLVGTLVESTCFLGEIPTGIVADLYSRRSSVIVGILLFGAGFVLEGSIPRFWSVMVAQVIWGLGATFISGALEAWIADEVGEEKAGRAYLRAAQVSLVGGVLGAGAGALLAGVSVSLPIVGGGALMMLMAPCLALVMPETGFKPAAPSSRNGWESMARTARAGVQAVRARPALLTILAIGAVFGMFSEGLDRLWTPHLVQDFALPPLGPLKPVAWFGFITAVGMILGVLATEVVRRRVDTTSHRAVGGALALIYAGLVVGVAAFGAAGSFPVALVALSVVQPLRRAGNPLYTTWVNQRLDPSVRATVISASAQADALGQVLGGPLIGVVATVVSLRSSLVVAAAVLLPTLLLFARTIREHSKPRPPA